MSGGQGQEMRGCNTDRTPYKDHVTIGTGKCGGGAYDNSGTVRCIVDIGAVAEDCYSGWYDITLSIANEQAGGSYSGDVRYFVCIKETSGTDTYRVIWCYPEDNS